MNRKVILIGAGVLVLIAIISVLYLSSKKSPTSVTNNSTTGSTSSGGGLTNVTPGTTSATSNTNFTVTDDPTQPFASISPRGNEPVKNTGSSSTGTQFDDYNKAVAAGTIPDQNGLYHQTVNPNDNPYSNPDNSLSSTDFLNKYYGSGAVASTNSGTDSFEQSLNSGSGGLVVAPSDTTTTAIATDATVAGAISNISSDNSAAAINTYYSALTSATASFDLVKDLQQHYLEILSSNTPQDLAVLKGETETAKAAIAKLAVPSKLLGMSQHYYALYDTYSSILDDAALVLGGQTLSADQQAQLDSAYSSLSDSMNNIKSDLIVMRNILNQH